VFGEASGAHVRTTSSPVRPLLLRFSCKPWVRSPRDSKVEFQLFSAVLAVSAVPSYSGSSASSNGIAGVSTTLGTVAEARRIFTARASL